MISLTLSLPAPLLLVYLPASHLFSTTLTVWSISQYKNIQQMIYAAKLMYTSWHLETEKKTTCSRCLCKEKLLTL
jgi:hypothetical protein